jgi:hypothetical protein
VEKRLQILQKLNQIDGVDLPNKVIDRRPSIDLDIFSTPEKVEALLAVFDWIVDEILAS